MPQFLPFNSLDLTTAAIQAPTVNDIKGGIPFTILVTVPDAATGNIDTGLAPFSFRVIDVWAIKTAAAGGAANTVQVLNTAQAVSDAISINIADKAVARAAELDDAGWNFDEGDLLRVTRTKAGGNAACVVRIDCVRT